MLFVIPFERIKSFGERNPQLTYYIIGRESWAGNGLFSCAIAVVSAIEYAVERGYIPVVDMKNSDNAYLYPNEIGNVNAWDYYFEQPLANINKKLYSLDEAYHSKSVIVNNADNGGIVQALYPATIPSLLRKNNKILQRWGTQYKKYVRLNARTQRYVDDQYNKIIHEDDRVLGIFVRGGEYRLSRPYGHPIQPEICDIICNARLFMEKWNCNKIFLTTEDEDILREFTDAFGDEVISTERRYIKYVVSEGEDGQSLRYIKPPEREREKYLSGLEYLTDVYIMSRCNCIIGSTTCGMIASVLMSQGYEHSYFFDCGVFGITDKKKCSNFSPSQGTWVLK
ncbi:MAG: hypothetical protein WC179_07365 [Candidatus Cloacimonadaceae bacterium]